MSCEGECRSCEVALKSNEVSGGFRKNSRISYSRDCLLSFAEVNYTKALPTGFDRSILSELDDTCKSAPENQKLPGLESVYTSRTWGDSSRDSSEKWGNYNLSSKDCKFTGHAHSNQSHHSWQKPGSTAILTSIRNPELNSILGSWSTSKLPSAGSEGSVIKLPGTDSGLLSRCNEPYRPPSFYKAMNHSGKLKYGTSSNGISECAEWSNKARSMEGNWRKDTCLVLEDHSAAPAVTSNKSPSPISPSIPGSVESVCSIGEASEKYRTEENPDHHPLTQFTSKNQLIEVDSGVAISKEQLQPFQGQILDGGRFSALMNLEEAEDIDAYFLDEKYDVMVNGRNGSRTKSKFIHWFPDNDNYDGNILSEAERDGWKVWREPTGMSMQVNPLGQKKSKEATTYGQKASFREKSKTCVIDCLDSDSVVLNCCSPDRKNLDSRIVKEPELEKIADEAGSSLELNLPDEDSLITVDGIYIFEQEEPNSPEIPIRGERGVSPFRGSNKLKGSESVQEKLSSPDPQYHEPQINSKNLFVHPSDSLACVSTPPTIQDSWKNRYNPIPFAPPPFGQLPLKPNYDSVENFLSPKMPRADDYCPDLDKILSADPSIYHQFLQSPRYNQESNVLRSLPLNYQTNVKSDMYMGKRGFHAEESNNSPINHHLQIQRKLAQISLEAAEHRAYSKAISNRFW
ncbi:uncharacterized protein LOC110729585 [Chenopodium quinoa]|uniref:Uncharacterized protein n=1 Tax=Chenopodium quinoa TaxID=63459 RepID=A0A803M066_CHEQI|nr:uncharacterized protein LOC110729585 [Chenopodium quinoa]